MKPIANRIYRAIFIISLISLSSLVVTLLIANETLENSMLRMESSAAQRPVLSTIDPASPFIWHSGFHQVAFVPDGQPLPPDFPSLFLALQTTDMAEVEQSGQTYLLNKQISHDGILYIGRNITAFEQREDKFNRIVFVLVVLIALLSWWLARLSSRTITTPLKNLSHTIQQLPIGPNLPHLKTNYQDQELYEIAITFNRFLDELNAYMQREKHLLNLASHELRTPIAVMAGAIEIIAYRGQLSEADQTTLERLKRANDEMAVTIEAILRLSRYEVNSELEPVILVDLTQQLLLDLQNSGAEVQRLYIHPHSRTPLNTQPTFAKMLLRNLIQNALQHTTGPIHLHIYLDHIQIHDEGNGLTSAEQARLHQPNAPTAGGLGLYIVTLISEKLGWHVRWHSEAKRGTHVQINFGLVD